MLAANCQQPAKIPQETSCEFKNFEIFEVEVEFQALTLVYPRLSFEF
jgi:hypothetical protein